MTKFRFLAQEHGRQDGPDGPDVILYHKRPVRRPPPRKVFMSRLDPEVRVQNVKKKPMRCLGLGCMTVFKTTPGHRFCKKCTHQRHRGIEPHVIALADLGVEDIDELS